VQQIEIAMTFTDENGEKRREVQSVKPLVAPEASGEHRIAHILFTELRVAVGEQTEPRHNAIALKWLEFPNQPVGFDQYFNIQNSQALWFELVSLILGAEAD